MKSVIVEFSCIMPGEGELTPSGGDLADYYAALLLDRLKTWLRATYPERAIEIVVLAGPGDSDTLKDKIRSTAYYLANPVG